MLTDYARRQWSFPQQSLSSSPVHQHRIGKGKSQTSRAYGLCVKDGSTNCHASGDDQVLSTRD